MVDRAWRGKHPLAIVVREIGGFLSIREVPSQIRNTVVIVSLPLLILSCSSQTSSEPAGGGQGGRGGGRGAGSAPVPVVTARVEQKAAPVTLPAVGTVEVDCEVLLTPEHDQRLIVYSARPGTEAHEQLRLLRVVGLQDLARPEPASGTGRF